MSPTPFKSRVDGAPKQPWWRVGMMWLVLGGPALVVVASVVTGVIAYRGADEVLTESSGPAPDASAANRALAPAMTARNHAATPSR